MRVFPAHQHQLDIFLELLFQKIKAARQGNDILLALHHPHEHNVRLGDHELLLDGDDVGIADGHRIGSLIGDPDLFLGHAEQVADLKFGGMGNRQHQLGFLCGSIDHSPVGGAVEDVAGLVARQAVMDNVMDGDYKGHLVHDRDIEIREVHQVQTGFAD